jgi:hypothetical protein
LFAKVLNISKKELDDMPVVQVAYYLKLIREETDQINAQMRKLNHGN